MDTLKVARVRAGLTQGEAAAKIGVGYPTLWRWEAGRSAIPAWAFLRLADLYGVDCRSITIAPPPDHTMSEGDSDAAYADRHPRERS